MRKSTSKCLLVYTILLPSLVICFPSESYVATTEKTGESVSKEGNEEADTAVPKIYEMQIDVNISNRFARSLIASKVSNKGESAKETTFSVIMPDKAFISEFEMVIDGKSYKAYVKEKTVAKQIYDQARASGRGAAHVEASARDSNRFTVSVNIEPQKKVVFLLTYEELLSRRDGKYEMIINIHPKQQVKDLYVNVMINESRPLKFVNAPPLRTGNEIADREGDFDPRALVAILNSTSAIIKFSPSIERQKELASSFGTDVKEGLSAQFVVQYDVERDPSGGEVLIQNGHFVHFFAPENIKPLNKYILFVLDTSGSMWGDKIKQLVAAMNKIFDEMDNNDFFHLLSFERTTKTWDVNNPGASVTSPSSNQWFTQNENDTRITDAVFPRAFPATIDNIQNAKKLLTQFQASGGTNIYEALRIALHLARREIGSGEHEEVRQPMIMFLTDGEPNSGITSTSRIISDISKFNSDKIAIYSLSFGAGGDKEFLKKLSLNNMGFSKHIYTGSDASLQLEHFYKQIASPLLRNVKFEYVPETTSLTRTNFPVHFKESELVVAGKVDFTVFPGIPRVTCISRKGPISLEPVIEQPVTSLERLWAYLTVQQLLEKRELADNKTIIERDALNLALKYSFVTKISSLVVVKPEGTDSDVNTEAGDKSLAASRMYGGRPQHRARPNLPVILTSGLSAPVIPMSRYMPSAGDKGSRMYIGGLQHQARLHIPDHLTSVFARSGQPVPRFQTSSYRSSATLSARVPTVKPGALGRLKLALPWLTSILNNEGFIRTPAGNYYLGINTTTPTTIDCPETPNNVAGHCKLLHECPQVHNILDTVEKFNKYYCHFDLFAGICCPVIP